MGNFITVIVQDMKIGFAKVGFKIAFYTQPSFNIRNIYILKVITGRECPCSNISYVAGNSNACQSGVSKCIFTNVSNIIANHYRG